MRNTGGVSEQQRDEQTDRQTDRRTKNVCYCWRGYKMNDLRTNLSQTKQSERNHEFSESPVDYITLRQLILQCYVCFKDKPLDRNSSDGSALGCVVVWCCHGNQCDVSAAVACSLVTITDRVWFTRMQCCRCTNSRSHAITSPSVNCKVDVNLLGVVHFRTSVTLTLTYNSYPNNPNPKSNPKSNPNLTLTVILTLSNPNLNSNPTLTLTLTLTRRRVTKVRKWTRANLLAI